MVGVEVEVEVWGCLTEFSLDMDQIWREKEDQGHNLPTAKGLH